MSHTRRVNPTAVVSVPPATVVHHKSFNLAAALAKALRAHYPERLAKVIFVRRHGVEHGLTAESPKAEFEAALAAF